MFLVSRTKVMGTGLCLAIAASTVAIAADADSVRANAPEIYIVKKGDTLWDISKRFLHNPWEWKKIWVNNPQIKNPHWIYPKDTLLLCNVLGQKRIGLDSGTGCQGISELAMGKLSPSIRSTPIDDPIAQIPLGEIRSWLKNGAVFDKATLKSAPYIVSMGERQVLAATGDTVYVRGDAITVGANYGFYRAGEQFIDPVTKAKLGWEATLVGRGIVIAKEKDVASVQIKEIFDSELRTSDRMLLEVSDEMPSIFEPTNARDLPQAQIIRVMGSVGNATVRSVVALNTGKALGAKPNDLVAIYRKGLLIRDPRKGDPVRLPNERAGLAMIFKTFDKVSYAYILESADILKVGDITGPAL